MYVQTEPYSVFRNGVKIGQYQGSRGRKKVHNHDIFLFDAPADIQVDDKIINDNSHEEYYAVDTDTINSPPYNNPRKIVCYQTKAQYLRKNTSHSPSQVIINVTDSPGSIIGTNPSGTINYGFTDLEALIKANSRSPEDFTELLNALKEVIGKDSIPKGFLSKFDDQLNKHSWLITGITQVLLQLFVNKPPTP